MTQTNSPPAIRPGAPPLVQTQMEEVKNGKIVAHYAPLGVPLAVYKSK